jgi:hypothetical protein
MSFQNAHNVSVKSKFHFEIHHSRPSRQVTTCGAPDITQQSGNCRNAILMSVSFEISFDS